MDNNQNNLNQSNQQNEGWSYDNGQFYTSVPPIDSANIVGNSTATASLTLGIVGLIISLACCGMIGIVLGIIALNKATTAKNLLLHEPAEVKVGRVCAINAIVWGAIHLAVIVALLLLSPELTMSV